MQDNESHSRRGVLRGLHYQLPPSPQGKLVRVVAGAALDVGGGHPPRLAQLWPVGGRGAERRQQAPAVDSRGLRAWFVALSDDTRFLYKTTDFYAKDCERAIRWNDPAIGITWPDAGPALLAPKDADAPLLRDAALF